MVINGNTLTGVRPGKGFYETLLAPRERKPYISNESRLEDGIRVLPTPPKYAPRSFSLEFQITGGTVVEFENNRAALYQQLNAVDSNSNTKEFTLQIPEVNNDVYHLFYTGKSATYARSRSGRACKIKVGFDEPKPGDRTVHTT